MKPADDAGDQVFAEGGDDLDEKERAALHASIDESIEDEAAGNAMDLAKIIVELRTGSANAELARVLRTRGTGSPRSSGKNVETLCGLRPSEERINERSRPFSS